MKTIRPDAPERFAECLTLVDMIRNSSAEQIREQHLGRLERVIAALRDSLEDKTSDV